MEYESVIVILLINEDFAMSDHLHIANMINTDNTLMHFLSCQHQICRLFFYPAAQRVEGSVEMLEFSRKRFIYSFIY